MLVTKRSKIPLIFIDSGFPMKALNQYTFAGAVSAVFLAIASYYVKFASMSVLALSFATVGVFSTALVFFLAAQLTYTYFFPETATSPTKQTSSDKLDAVVIPDRLSEQAQAVIGINMNKICQTSGWYNNCGLNCMTHFMFTKLSAIPKNQFARFLKDNPEYDSFLSTFQTYYGLSQKPDWPVVLTLLADHTRSDREAIFAPVLRSHIGKIMPTFANELFDTKLSAALSDYIKTGRTGDNANAVFKSNQRFFEQYKAEFGLALKKVEARKPTRAERAKANVNLEAKKKNKDFLDFVITEEDILDNIQLQRKSNLEDKMLPKAKAHWISQGCKAYADYVADLDNAEMISADQLQWLGQQFNIGVEIYTPASMERAISDPTLGAINHGMQSKPEGDFKWTMRVHNSGVHWTFEEANQSQDAANEHNANFYRQGNKSSQLKKLGSPESIATIKKAIHEMMNAPKMLLHKHTPRSRKSAAPAVVLAKALARKRKAPAR